MPKRTMIKACEAALISLLVVTPFNERKRLLKRVQSHESEFTAGARKHLKNLCEMPEARIVECVRAEADLFLCLLMRYGKMLDRWKKIRDDYSSIVTKLGIPQAPHVVTRSVDWQEFLRLLKALGVFQKYRGGKTHLRRQHPQLVPLSDEAIAVIKALANPKRP